MKLARLLVLLMCGAGMRVVHAAPPQPINDYTLPSAWLCFPGRTDACAAPVTSTVVAPDSGELTKRTYTADPAAPIDCFYVYPTVSLEPTGNADMTPGPEEQHVALEQFARFGAKCRTFAPLYRQTTVAALNGDASGADYELPYRDVVAAWHAYLAHDNHGRGVVLIGHSQGAKLLTRLIATEIDGRPIQRQLVSAILLGTGIYVPTGQDVGGTFHHVPLCHEAAQAGCVIAYSSYLAIRPPDAAAVFGDAAPGFTNACVNPGALTHDGTLDAEVPTRGAVAQMLGTAFVENPGVISGTCVTAGSRTYLEISIKEKAYGAQKLESSFVALDGRRPGWGLHALDMHLALGAMVEIVGRQGQAWTTHAR